MEIERDYYLMKEQIQELVTKSILLSTKAIKDITYSLHLTSLTDKK